MFNLKKHFSKDSLVAIITQPNTDYFIPGVVVFIFYSMFILCFCSVRLFIELGTLKSILTTI